MELLIHIPDTLGERIQALPDPEAFVQAALERALEMHRTRRMDTLRAVEAFKPFQGKRSTTDIIREARERLQS